MNCRRAQVRLSPWLDGEIEHDAGQALADHLAQCAQCRGRADAMRDMRARFQRLPPIEPSHDFDARVWRRIEHTSTSRLRRWLAGAGEATADLAPRWATAVFVTAAFLASIYWASQASALQARQGRTPYDDVESMMGFDAFNARPSILEWHNFWRLPGERRDG